MNRLQKFLLYAILILGLCLRFAEYAANRSLTIDEATTAYRISSVSLTDLALPQDNSTEQMAGYPAGFFLIEKAAAKFIGTYEWALRFFPYFFGILALLLFARASLAFLGNSWGLLATALFAVSRDLVYYSSEVKPYSLDVCLTVLFIYYVGERANRPWDKKQVVQLGIAGAAVGYFSFAAFFSVLAVLAGLVILFALRKEILKARLLFFSGLIVVAGFAVYYIFSLQHFRADQDLAAFWNVNFIPFREGPFAVFQWVVVSFKRIFVRALQIPAVLGSALALLGVVGLWKRDKVVWVLVTAPVLLTLVLSAMRIYPFDGRVIAFLLPLFMLLVTEGAAFITRHLSPGFRRACSFALMAGLLVTPLRYSLRQFQEPFGPEEIKPVLSYIQKNWQRGDTLMVHQGAVPAFRYYRQRYGLDENPFVLGDTQRLKVPVTASDYETLVSHQRAWVVFTHVPHYRGISERRHVLSILDKGWERVDDFVIKASSEAFLTSLDQNISASAHLYEIPPQPTKLGRF